MEEKKLTSEMFKKNLDLVIERNGRQPERMNAKLELELLDCSAEKPYSARYLYRSKELFTNPYGGVHGGVVSTLADTCSGYTLVALTMKAVSTTDMSVNFLRELKAETFDVCVECTHVGRKLASTYVRICDHETGELCATAITTFIIFEGVMPGLRV